MARTAINVYDQPGIKDDNGTVITPTAGDPINDHSAAFNGKNLLIVAEATGSVTVTIKSTEDPIYGRTGDHTLVMNTGEIAIFGAYQRSGFVQSDGLLHIDLLTDQVNLYGIRV